MGKRALNVSTSNDALGDGPRLRFGPVGPPLAYQGLPVHAAVDRRCMLWTALSTHGCLVKGGGRLVRTQDECCFPLAFR